MLIGEAARRSQLSSKMIRHYETIGLLGATVRSDNGYRRYSEDDLQVLHFIRQARELGFSLVQIKQLVSLWQDQTRDSHQVKALALEHIAGLEQKISQLSAMRDQLQQLAQRCHGQPDCPILAGIERGRSTKRQ